jgi:hypothetical protein
MTSHLQRFPLRDFWRGAVAFGAVVPLAAAGADAIARGYYDRLYFAEIATVLLTPSAMAGGLVATVVRIAVRARRTWVAGAAGVVCSFALFSVIAGLLASVVDFMRWPVVGTAILSGIIGSVVGMVFAVFEASVFSPSRLASASSYEPLVQEAALVGIGSASLAVAATVGILRATFPFVLEDVSKQSAWPPWFVILQGAVVYLPAAAIVSVRAFGKGAGEWLVARALLMGVVAGIACAGVPFARWAIVRGSIWDHHHRITIPPSPVFLVMGAVCGALTGILVAFLVEQKTSHKGAA